MDIHRQLAAWLAIAAGALGLLTVLGMVLLISGVVVAAGIDTNEMRVFAFLIKAVCGVIGVLSLADIIAGICYLRGSQVARGWLIVTNILFLLAFPLGSLIGAYSLWAMLRTVAAPARDGTTEIDA